MRPKMKLSLHVSEPLLVAFRSHTQFFGSAGCICLLDLLRSHVIHLVSISLLLLGSNPRGEKRRWCFRPLYSSVPTLFSA